MFNPIPNPGVYSDRTALVPVSQQTALIPYVAPVSCMDFVRGEVEKYYQRRFNLPNDPYKATYDLVQMATNLNALESISRGFERFRKINISEGIQAIIDIAEKRFGFKKEGYAFGHKWTVEPPYRQSTPWV